MYFKPQTLALLVAGVLLLAGCAPQAAAPLAPTTALVASPTPVTPSPPVAQPSAQATPGPTAAPAPSPASSALPTPSSLPAAYPFTRTLALQTPPLVGDDVRALQAQLLALGYRQVGEVDGIFGPRTADAVTTFQSINNLMVDGVAGPLTQGQLFAAAAVPGWAVVPIIETVLCGEALLLGASYQGYWFENAVAGTLLRDPTTYRQYNAAGPVGSVTGNTTQVYPDPPYGGQFIVTLNPASNGDNTIGIGDDWNAAPRAARVISDAAVLQQNEQVVADYLVTQGVAQAARPNPDTFTVWQVDLDGDGGEETLIGANYFSNDEAASEPEYSLVLLVQNVQGQQETSSLMGDIYPQGTTLFNQSTRTPFANLDLNGDGLMEILVESVYFESSELTVYSLIEGRASLVLATWCGV